MDKFIGKWQMHDSSNFDEYMKELGVGMLVRKIASNTKPSQEISVENGITTIKTVSTLKTTEIKFKLDEEFDELTGDDKKLKSIVRKESDTKFVQIQKRDEDSIITRELVGDEFIMTLQYKKVTAVRKYKLSK